MYTASRAGGNTCLTLTILTDLLCRPQGQRMAAGCLCRAAQHQPRCQDGAGLHPLRADGDTTHPLLRGAGLPMGKQQPGAG